MKVIFFISRLFWQDEVFALLQFAHDCDFCQKLAAPQAFQCQQKTDRTAWQLVRSGMLENRLISSFRCFLDLLFQRFSWSPPFRYIVGVTLADIPFPFLFSKSESALRRIQLCQLLENSICPFAAPSQDINTPDINSCVSLALGKVLKSWTPNNLFSVICLDLRTSSRKPWWRFVSKVFANEKFQIYKRHIHGQA